VERLQLRGVLQRDAAGRLTFAVPLFQRWLVEQGYDHLAAAVRYNDDRRAGEPAP